MEQYISKSALVAEIERRVNNLYPKNGQGMILTKVLNDHYKDLKNFLDTLEVKEVDLEKEEERIWKDFNIGEYYLSKNDLEKISKHFFELGLKLQKGE